jgi:hypothetical protein
MHSYFDDIREKEYDDDNLNGIIEKPIILNNRALSPDALVYGKNQLKQNY